MDTVKDTSEDKGVRWTESKGLMKDGKMKEKKKKAVSGGEEVFYQFQYEERTVMSQ